MKRFLTILMITILFSACSKDSENENPNGTIVVDQEPTFKFDYSKLTEIVWEYDFIIEVENGDTISVDSTLYDYDLDGKVYLTIRSKGTRDTLEYIRIGDKLTTYYNLNTESTLKIVELNDNRFVMEQEDGAVLYYYKPF